MKKCLFCNKEFKIKAKNQLYCSTKCKRAIRTTCAHCGKEIVRTKNQKGIYFCDIKCASLHSGRTIIKECKYCGKPFEAQKSSLEYGWGNYCSKECANKGREITHYKICPQCGKTYAGDKNNWMNQKFCSKECMKAAFRNPIDKDLLVKLYVEEEMTSREIGEIIGRSKKVVLDYLKHYGIKVRPDGIKSRERIKCQDGHLVRSYYERAFDNILHRNNIAHEYDPRLPFNKRYMADFKVGDVYVEIWGLMNLAQYREKRERKLALYRANGCKLLEVYPDDFRNLQNKIDELKSLMCA